MLIRFEADNWKSFRKINFSAIASRERSHGKRLSIVENYRMRVLPVTALYGGNASGKTNFFSALNFVRRFIVTGNAPGNAINIEPFALSRKSQKQASSFRLEILADDTVYEYYFRLSKSEVLEERLTKIGLTSEDILFDRHGDQYVFSSKSSPNEALRYVAEGTQPNILFLTNTVFQRKDEYLSVYNWFKALTLIAPDSRFAAFDVFKDENSPIHLSNNELLEMFDTGVIQTGAIDVPPDQIPFLDKIREDLEAQLKMGSAAKINGDFNHEKYVFQKTSKGLSAKKMVTIHPSLDNNKGVKFSMKDESDGTLRLLDLIPMLHQLMDKNVNRVFVVDEIDRSFHYMLTKKILELYLKSCNAETRSQLLFTTHDLLLMDQKLFRRDEMWITERSNGESELMSIGDFQLRYDKNVLKAYLNGRFGGIPKIF